MLSVSKQQYEQHGLNTLNNNNNINNNINNNDNNNDSNKEEEEVETSFEFEWVVFMRGWRQ